MLKIEGLHSYYGESHVLNGVSLDVPAGQVVAMLGRNGVGKTTLLHSTMSLVKPRSGSITLGGEELAGKPAHQIARRGLALVPQGHRIFRSLSVAENLAVARKRGSFPGTRVWEEEEVYQAFPVLGQRRGQKAGSLSGGEQQMLAMGRAFVSGPRALLLDEPSEGLAPLIVKEIGKVIRGLTEQGMAVLLVEQNFQFAMEIADRVFVMSRGTVVHESSPAELARNEEVKSRYLGM